MYTVKQLEQVIREGIPIAGKMNFQLRELQPESITVVGGGDENINVHGTAFAGSLYSICTLALWGLVFSRLPQGASLVMAEASIRYRRPVVGDIVAHCAIDADAMQNFLARLEARGRAVLPASVQVDVEEAVAVEFQATMHARLNRE